jgi:hypothetical protein
MKIPFCGPTYQSRSTNIDADRCINFFPEISQRDSKDLVSLIGTPGTSLFASCGQGPIRGVHVWNNQMWVVSGNQVCSVTTTGTVANVGTISTSNGPVSMADNGLTIGGVGGNQLMIADGANGYIVTQTATMPFTNGSANATGLYLQNIPGNATAFCASATVTSGSYAGANANGTFNLSGWNGGNFDTGAGTFVYTTGGLITNLLTSWANGSPGYTHFASSGANITQADVGVSISGGTIVDAYGMRTHKFTSSVTITVNTGGTISVLVVGGGGTGGSGSGGGTYFGVGGSAGQVYYNASYTLANGSYSITIGGSDQASVFDVVTATAGTAGGQGPIYNAGDGGSGAGGGGGSHSGNTYGGSGGQGVSYSISGSLVSYGGGGGGCGFLGGGSASSGGGAGGTGVSGSGTAGTPNTGGGGGGGGGTGAAGGSGIVIISYPYPSAVTSVTANTTSMTTIVGLYYQVKANVALANLSSHPVLTGTDGVNATTLYSGMNTINFQATGTSCVLTLTSNSSANFTGNFTMGLPLTAVATASAHPTLTPSLSTIDGGGWPGNPTHVAYLDGYFIITTAGSMKVYCSNLYDGTTWNALATAAISSSPDACQTVAELAQQLWFIKQNTVECWYDAGVATSVGFPFARVSGGVLDGGTPAPWSVARAQGFLFFLGNIRNQEIGELMGVLQLSGNGFQIVSPTAINYQISQWPSYSDAIGFCYSQEGHNFYVLTSPSANGGIGQTFVYDLTTQMWHERSTCISSLNPNYIGRHVSNFYGYLNNQHYVGDWNSGNIYLLSSGVYTDNGQQIISIRQASHLSDKETLRNMFFHKLIVDAETGVGGTGAYASLSWSNDGGHTWSNEYLASVGKTGQYITRLIWRRLGYARDRIFKLIMSDPIKKVIIGGYIE